MDTRNRMWETPTAETKDVEDVLALQAVQVRYEGRQRQRNRYPQSDPVFFTDDQRPLWLGDLFRGRSAFLIAGGPSFAGLDHSCLRQPGILTVGLNNAVKSFRPNLWISVDSPDHFVRSVWLDPCIMKFAPICHAEKLIFNSDSWRFMDTRAEDCPNVVFFRRNERFIASEFLWEESVNWGSHKKYGGGRSVMLAALRILFILGIRIVYLLGVDFRMNATVKYHFSQERRKGSIEGNNSTYRKLQERFAELRPLFEKEDFHVYNCNPHSSLKVFDYVSYEEAVRRSLAEFDFVDTERERTEGLYDTSTEDKRAGKGN